MFKVGDKVKIKLNPPKDDGQVGWVRAMDILVGNICTIREVHTRYGTYYKVKENRFNWNDCWLESHIIDHFDEGMFEV